MPTVPTDLRELLRQHGQEHVLAAWDRLAEPERRELLDQLQRLDLAQLRRLYEQRDRTDAVPPPGRIQPPPVVRLDVEAQEARRLGESALKQGEVAVLVVAGGQGSRLGFDHPKGMFPVGPVTGKSLFQIHAEKTLALARRHGKPIPFLVMTSPATQEETESFFREQGFFGLLADQVYFFCQGTMPALDMQSGRLILEKPGRLFTSPNGHGGTLTALAESGLLDRLRHGGVTQIFYFQVDNPLVKVADPIFLGHHLAARAQVSSKIVAKEGPTDKLGNVVVVDGRCTIIEYSDLPIELARQTDEGDRLRIWAGSPAIHFFDVGFLTRVVGGQARMPFHVARKKVPYVNDWGETAEPERENAFKFEMFIFDVLPLADRWTVVETTRREEFMPLKNASGADSPETVRQALSDLAADWLEKAGVRVPRRADGGAAVPLEISPLVALEAGDLATRVNPALQISGPFYLG
jgi:UDP-N-acetylglucosamine/UDP-N-acetylgalactosamine diphosphorylase